MEISKILLPEKDITKELESIWIDHYENESANHYIPFGPKEILPISILFLAINPSISGNHTKGTKLDFWHMDFNVEFKKSCEKPHTHFKKFFELKDSIQKTMGRNYNYSYMDLLYLQETHQKDVMRISDTTFIINQAKITIEIINKIRPRLVIVCNTGAAGILFRHKEKIGFTPILKNEVYHLNKIPFIIDQSKYMGGQNYLSKLKKEEKQKSLLNEIKTILEKTEDWYK
jgi:hypothetical protein